jgi:hypothetical protein
MIDEMIEKVRAAFEPGADVATKQQAAAILRGVLGMLEQGSQPAATGGAPTSPVETDLLGRIVEYVRPYLPEEALQQMPRFRVPLIDLNRR